MDLSIVHIRPPPYMYIYIYIYKTPPPHIYSYVIELSYPTSPRFPRLVIYGALFYARCGHDG